MEDYKNLPALWLQSPTYRIHPQLHTICNGNSEPYFPINYSGNSNFTPTHVPLQSNFHPLLLWHNEHQIIPVRGELQKGFLGRNAIFRPWKLYYCTSNFRHLPFIYCYVSLVSGYLGLLYLYGVGTIHIKFHIRA